MDMKERLTQYAEAAVNIDGLETFIISPKFYGRLPGLMPGTVFERESVHCVKAAEEAKGLDLSVGVCHNPNFKSPPLAWRPVLCYKRGEDFFHVMYRKKWLCRSCKFDGHPVIMQLADAEPDAYFGFARPAPSPLFKNLKCKNCGRLLQGYLIPAEGEKP